MTLLSIHLEIVKHIPQSSKRLKLLRESSSQQLYPALDI